MNGIITTDDHVALDFSEKQAWVIVSELGIKKNRQSIVDVLQYIKANNDDEGFYTDAGEKLIKLAGLCTAIIENKGDKEIVAALRERIKELSFFEDFVWT